MIGAKGGGSKSFRNTSQYFRFLPPFSIKCPDDSTQVTGKVLVGQLVCSTSRHFFIRIQHPTVFGGRYSRGTFCWSYNTARQYCVCVKLKLPYPYHFGYHSHTVVDLVGMVTGLTVLTDWMMSKMTYLFNYQPHHQVNGYSPAQMKWFSFSPHFLDVKGKLVLLDQTTRRDKCDADFSQIFPPPCRLWLVESRGNWLHGAGALCRAWIYFSQCVAWNKGETIKAFITPSETFDFPLGWAESVRKTAIEN